MENKKFKPERLLGVRESIASLSAKDVTVHLASIKTERGFVALWLADDQITPLGIMIGDADAPSVAD
jgi:hypothetical protein